MKWIIIILIVFICSSAFATDKDYIKYSVSPAQFEDFYDGKYLKLDFTNTPPSGTFGMQFDRVSENKLDLYIAGVLFHTWEFVPIVVPPPPEFDIGIDFVNGIGIDFTNGVGIIFAE